MAQGAIQLNFEQSLLANALNQPDKSQYVYNLTQGYNVLDLFMSNRAKPRQVVGDGGQFEKAVLGSNAVTGVIQSAVVNGSGNLVVTFTTSNTKFREKTLIGDGSAAMNLGYCVAATGSTIELQPTTAIGTWNTATQFVVGRTAVEITPAAGDRNSTPPVPQYYIPEYYRNNTGIVSERMTLNRRDKHQTYPRFKGGFWSFAQEPMMLQNFAMKLEMRAFWAQRSTVNSPLEGNVSIPRGWREAILDPLYGGIYAPLANVPTAAQFDKFITDCSFRINCTSYTLFCGTGFYNAMQGFTSITNAIEFSGNTNTFGGKDVEGLNFTVYAVNGIKCTIVPVPLFNNPYYFPGPSNAPGALYPRMSYTCVAIPDQEYIGTDGQQLPTVEKCYFGDREMEFGVQLGIGMGSGPGAVAMSKSAPLISTLTDSVTLEIYTDCCYDLMGYGAGLMELIV